MNSRRAWLGACLAAVMLAPLSAFGQSARNLQAAEIARIAHTANRIDNGLANSAARMKTFSRGTESGVLSLYTSSSGSRKLVVQLVSLESGYVTEYYFLGNQLIYVVQACKSFGSVDQRSSTTNCTTISENRYYLSGGDLVAWQRGTGPGPVAMREVAADQGMLEQKLGQITRSASTWLAFAESPMKDFDRFEAERQTGN